MTENTNGHLRVLKKLSAVMADVGFIGKDATNSFHNYKYASEKAIKMAVHPALVKHGIVLQLNAQTPQMMTGEPDKQGKVPIIQYVPVEYIFWDVESGESLSGHFVGSGDSKDDKGYNKAITGAIKYILTSNLLIPTGDDPENEGNGSARSKSFAKKPAGESWPSHQTTDPQLTSGKPDQATPAQIAAIEKMAAKLPASVEKERFQAWLEAPNRPKAVASGMIGELQKILDGAHA